MGIDLNRAESFLAASGRLLDRRRLAAIAGPGADEPRLAVLAALSAYRNADGGYGWGIEPDLRAPESQPAGALHAMEAIADAGPQTTAAAIGLLDWLDSVTISRGGLPLALPVDDPSACAPFWISADPGQSSLQITAAVAAQAHRVGQDDAAVSQHPWLARATRYCFEAIAQLKVAPPAHELSFALQLLDITAETHPESAELLNRLGEFVPPDGALPVAGGVDGETLRLLDFASRPRGAVRALLEPGAVDRDLDRLEDEQHADGGWAVDFTSYSEAASLEWRGYATVSAVSVLSANGRLNLR